MQITLLTVADYATIDQNGKLTAAGIFHQINARNLPFVHLNMYLLVELSFSRSEANRKFKLEVYLMDEDGRQILQVAGDAQTSDAQSEKWLHSYVVSVFQFANVTFDRAGTYQFSILIDGDEKGTLPLQVVEVRPQPPNIQQGQAQEFPLS